MVQMTAQTRNLLRKGRISNVLKEPLGNPKYRSLCVDQGQQNRAWPPSCPWVPQTQGTGYDLQSPIWTGVPEGAACPLLCSHMTIKISWGGPFLHSRLAVTRERTHCSAATWSLELIHSPGRPGWLCPYAPLADA